MAILSAHSSPAMPLWAFTLKKQIGFGESWMDTFYSNRLLMGSWHFISWHSGRVFASNLGQHREHALSVAIFPSCLLVSAAAIPVSSALFVVFVIPTPPEFEPTPPEFQPTPPEFTQH